VGNAQAHAGLGIDVGGGQPGLIAGERKRHGETRGVGCAEDLLGVGAAPVVLEAARKAAGVVLQRTGLGAYLALALLALAFPVHDGGKAAKKRGGIVRGNPLLHFLDFSFYFFRPLGIELFFIGGKLAEQSQKLSSVYTFLVRYLLEHFHSEHVVG